MKIGKRFFFERLSRIPLFSHEANKGIAQNRIFSYIMDIVCLTELKGLYKTVIGILTSVVSLILCYELQFINTFCTANDEQDLGVR